MLDHSSVQAWSLVHRWSSLICTGFLLLLCATGLPLIFNDEIAAWSEQEVQAPLLAIATPALGLDELVTKARAQYPQDYVQFAFWPKGKPNIVGLGMAPTRNAGLDQLNRRLFDARTAELLEDRPPKKGPMQTVLRLHSELLLDSYGTWILATMALLFIVAIISGTVLYGSFMKRLRFGTVRSDRGQHTQWLDLHNLLGIVTLVWALVVGITGFMNTLEKSLFSLWRAQTMPELLAPYKGKPPAAAMSSAAAAVATARLALPGMTPTSIGYPNSRFASPRHYLIWLRGDSPLTARLFNTVLVDADTGALAAARAMPWYLRALEISRPLHFGDYGGLPLKIIWALLDLITIVVLASGLCLWFKKRASSEKQLSENTQSPSGAA